MNTGYTVLASIICLLILFLFLSWLHVSVKYVGVKNNNNLRRWKNIIDAKNENLGWFDLGNHIIIIGAVLLAIFIVINAQ
jgi:cell division septal protein FtsQ